MLTKDLINRMFDKAKEARSHSSSVRKEEFAVILNYKKFAELIEEKAPSNPGDACELAVKAQQYADKHIDDKYRLVFGYSSYTQNIHWHVVKPGEARYNEPSDQTHICLL